MHPYRYPIVLATFWPLVAAAPVSAQAPTIDAPTGQALLAAGGDLPVER